MNSITNQPAINDDAQAAVHTIATRCVVKLLSHLHDDLDAAWDKADNFARMNHRTATNLSGDAADRFADELVSKIETELANAFQRNQHGSVVGPLLKGMLMTEIKDQLIRRRCNAEMALEIYGASKR